MDGPYNSLNQDYPSNAKKDVAKHVTESVATSSGTVKPNTFKRVLRAFFAEDAKSVKSYILTEVILPEVKRLFYDIIINGSHRLIFGSNGAPVNTNTGFTPYSSIANGTRALLNTGVQSARTANYSVYDYNNLLYSTQKEAEAVLGELIKLYKTYGFVSVGDLFDLSSQETKSTDYDYGWSFDISTVGVRPFAGGYIINLPQAMPRR